MMIGDTLVPYSDIKRVDIVEQDVEFNPVEASYALFGLTAVVLLLSWAIPRLIGTTDIFIIDLAIAWFRTSLQYISLFIFFAFLLLRFIIFYFNWDGSQFMVIVETMKDERYFIGSFDRKKITEIYGRICSIARGR